MRRSAYRASGSRLPSGLDDKTTGAIVIVAQRVHMDDLTGFLLSQSDEWDVLSLPAIAEFDQDVPVWRGVHHRKAGDVLSPERESKEVLDAIKLQMGGDAFSAQFQQRPVPPGGAMIKRDWIQRYDELPPRHERRLVLQSWDTASKGGVDNDWSVCTTWIITRGARFYLADVWRGRVDYPALKARAKGLAATWKASRILIEDTGAGTSLAQELRSHIFGVIPVRPERDKISRMSVVSSRFEAGQVYFPRQRSPWLIDLEDELFSFPVGRHDDQCDSISQALGDRNNRVLAVQPEVLPPPMVRDRYAKNFRYK